MNRRVFLASAAASLTGCADMHNQNSLNEERRNALIASSYQAVDRLVESQNGRVVSPGDRVLVATLVRLNNLSESSPLGRLLAEHAASRLVQLGLAVTELKLRGSLFVSEKEGELLLSREIREISTAHRAEALLVGTYTEAIDSVYVTMKLVRSVDGQIASAYNYAIPRNYSVNSLMSERMR